MAAASCLTEGNGSRYFNEFNELFNPEIDEVDIIPCVKSEEQGTAVVGDGNKIGILSWCVKELFCFAYKKLMKFKMNQKDFLKEGSNIMGLSRAILLLTAEDYTVWNLRKQYIVANESSRCDEMVFCAVVLKRHPRSSEAFAHRRWLIKELTKNKESPTSSICLSKELHLCLQCAEKYHDNYIAWAQRCWLVSQFMSDSIEELLRELQEMEHWLWMHISDYCCFHYRQHLLKHLRKLCSQTEMKELLLKESTMMDEMLRRYPGHETVWYHRRFLVDFWLSMNPPCDDCRLHWQNFEKIVDESKYLGNSKLPKCLHCDSSQKQHIGNLLPNCEMCFCQKIMTISNDRSAEQKRQSLLAASHLQWFHHFLQRKYSIGCSQRSGNST